MANACVFCGDSSQRLTDEHVMADWIGKDFGQIPTGISQITNAKGELTQWPSAPFSDVVKIVCQDRCNGGWMSDLEAAVKPILGPMMTRGWVTTLSAPTQQTLAFWAVKTALVIEHLHPRHRVVGDSEYGGLFAAQQPLPTHVVWIGRRNSPGDNLVSSLKESLNRIQVPADNHKMTQAIRQATDNGARMYRFTFSIGHVVFQVFGHNIPMTLQIEGGTGFHDVVQQIWPPKSDVTWPPPKSVESVGGTEGLHRAWGSTSRPTPEPSDETVPEPRNRAEKRAASRRKPAGQQYKRTQKRK